MNGRQILVVAAACACGIAEVAECRTLRVPAEFGTIGAAVAQARNNDTVLVSNGAYLGDDNLNVRIGAGVSVISEDGPADCVIDGEANPDTRAFIMATGSRVNGFTITRMMQNAIDNSSTQNTRITNCIFVSNVNRGNNLGTGVKLSTATDAIVEHCIFQDNGSFTAGAGMFIATNSVRVRVWDCIFSNNETTRFGGAMLITANSDADIGNCIFSGNAAGVDGGGLAFSVTGTGTVHNCTFIRNRAGGLGGGLYKGSNSIPTVVNSIFWGNSAATGNQLCAQDNGGEIRISYCLVEGGPDQAGRWNGQNIYSDPPEFVEGREPLWGLNWYYLDAESPAVDAGSTTADSVGMDTLFTSPEFEMDQDIVDLGFHYDIDSFLRVGMVWGYVTSAASGEGLFDVMVRTSRRRETITSEGGYWAIPDHKVGPLWIRFTREGFLDSTVTDLELAENETLRVDISMLHTEFTPSREDVRLTINAGDTAVVDFSVANGGSGVLTYRVEPRLVGEANRDPWSFRASFNFGRTVEDDRLNGVVMVDSLFYVCGANDTAANLVYIFNRAGEYVDSFPQFGEARYGMKDMTYDGELIWGSGEQNVFGFTLHGDLLVSFQAPLNPVDNIAYDSDRDLLWLSGITTGIIGVQRDGTPVDTITTRDLSLRKYGMFYWPNDPDGKGLYLLNRPTGNLNILHKLNPDQPSDTVRVATLVPDGDVPLSGASIAAYDIYSLVFMSVVNAGREIGGDRVDIWQLAGNTAWMNVTPRQGEIGPGSEEPFQLIINMAAFPIGRYEGQLYFTHNALFNEFSMPIFIRLEPNRIRSEATPLPIRAEIAAVHPNPFNGMTTLQYSLPAAGLAKLTIHDLTGREVARPVEEFVTAGGHRLTLNAQRWPSGVYIARLEAAGEVGAAKLVLMR